MDVVALLNERGAPGAVEEATYQECDGAGGWRDRVEHHLIADYFQDVAVLARRDDVRPRVFVLFHIREDAGPFYKDMIIRLLTAVASAAPGVAEHYHHLGDRDPRQTSDLVPISGT